ncbi:MAG: DNA-binding protein [Xanthobacteraceae bacterium]
MNDINNIISEEGALTLGEFCVRYGLSRSAAYREIKAMRLIAKKRGRRTVIERREAQRWLVTLPDFEMHTAA